MNIAEKLTTIAENVPKVYEAGQQAENNAFWDIITANGTRENYMYAFHNWGMEYIRPNRKIVPKAQNSSCQMFNACRLLKKVEKDCFDLSNIPKGITVNSGYYYTWYDNKELIEVEDIGIGRIAPYGYNYTWAGCSKLKYIWGMGFDANTLFDSVFNNCSELEELRIYEGSVIGKSGVNIRWSTKLSKTSIENIFAVLSTETSGLSITLSKAAVNKAFETAEGLNDGSTSTEWLELRATRTNWTINLL